MATPPQTLGEGDEVELRMRVGPISFSWVAVHRNFEENRRFDDIQKSGPFKRWHHSHIFEPVTDKTTRMIDSIQYELYGGGPVNYVGEWFVRRRLDRMFAYRHDQLASVFGSVD